MRLADNQFIHGADSIEDDQDVEPVPASGAPGEEKFADPVSVIRQGPATASDPPSKDQPPADPQERRREPRVPTHATAQVRILNPISPDRVTCRVLDVSKHGLKLVFHRFLQPATVIQVQLQQLSIMGEVRYCIAYDPEPGVFVVGVEFQDLHDW